MTVMDLQIDCGSVACPRWAAQQPQNL